VREVLEETGLLIKDDTVRFLTATNDIMASEHKHYVTIFMGCRPKSDGLEPRVGLNSCTFADGKCNIGRASADVRQVMEPEKCERWEWVTWQDMRRWAEVQMRQQDEDAAADESGRNSSAQVENRQLFLPLLSLLRQQSALDPGQSYELKP
jgi:8-oxo-dGTP diphosphatase